MKKEILLSDLSENSVDLTHIAAPAHPNVKFQLKVS